MDGRYPQPPPGCDSDESGGATAGYRSRQSTKGDEVERFDGRIAVVTGGGTGMGRELARQLSAEGCHVAMCDVSEENMGDAKALCDEGAPAGTRVTTFVADVSDEDQVNAFRDAVA